MNLKPTLLFFFIFGVCFSANSQIINKGVLKVTSNTTVYFHDEYTNAAPGNHVSDGDLYLNNNFINHGLTSAEKGTTYFKSAANNLLTLTGDSKKIDFYNLEIDVTATNKKGVMVADDFSLKVVNAVNLKSGDLRLSGDAQLIQSHPGIDHNTAVSGKLLRDQQGHSSSYQYDYWSSPINNGGTFSLLGGKFDGTDAAQNPFMPQQILFKSGAPYNGLPSETDSSGNVLTALTINTRWLYKYTRGSGAYSEWKRIKQTDVLEPGEGYIMKGPNLESSTKNYVYYGAPNNGDYSFPITTGERILLGNPYPSELNARQFLKDNSDVIDVLQFWVDGGSPSHYLSDYLGGYATFNLTGGVMASIPAELISGIGTAKYVSPPSKHMPIGKGFFVDAIGSGTINFNNSQRIFEVGTTPRSSKRESKDQNDDDKYIRIGFEDTEGFHRQLLLGFLPNSPADLSHNTGYDALQISTRKDDVFFIIDENRSKRYTIQGVNRYSEFMEFPMGFIISKAGSHQLMLDTLENFTETVYLKDNLLDITHNLTDSNFEVNLPSGEYLDRYSLVFQPSETLGTSMSDLDKTLVYYNGQKQIVITKPSHLEIKSIDIYNIVGQHMMSYSESLSNQNKILVPFNESPGVYMVVLNSNTSKKSTKILKY